MVVFPPALNRGGPTVATGEPACSTGAIARLNRNYVFFKSDLAGGAGWLAVGGGEPAFLASDQAARPGDQAFLKSAVAEATTGLDFKKSGLAF